MIDEIRNRLKNKFISTEDTIITRERHRQHIKQCIQHLESFETKKSESDFDKAAEDLRFEYAARLRDEIKELRRDLRDANR